MYVNKPWLKNYLNFPQEVKIPEVTLSQLIEESLKRNSGKTALIYYGTEISYSELGVYIDKIASSLYDLGTKKGSVVALYLPTCPQFIISYYAVQKLGGIPTAVNFLFSPREIKAQLEDSKPETIIMVSLLYEKTKQVIEELGIKNVVLTDITYFMPFIKRKMSVLLKKIPKAKIPKDGYVLYFEKMIKGNSVSLPAAEINPKEDVASIIYTSGTTGLPKGVALTHFNIIASMEQIKASSGDAFNVSKYLLAYLPLAHIYGQNAIMTGGLLNGQTLIVIMRPEFDELLRYIEKYKISLLFGVPAFYRILIERIKKGKYDLSSLKICACGSDYANQNLKDDWKKLTGANIIEGYGLTEAIPVTGNAIEEKVKDESVGFPSPSTLVAVAYPDKTEFVRVGDVGEIVVCGPQVMKGYWNSEKHPDPFVRIADKTWIRTGDLGFMDEDGYFYIVERIKDVIKFKGYMILPLEVENVISNYKQVKEVAVIGVQADETEFGQIVKAFIVPKEEYKDKIKKDDIINYCRDQLAYYKIPQEVQFIEKLPRNQLGKVIRKELRGD